MNSDNQTRTVLIVDDSETNLRLVSEIVAGEGYDILYAQNGRDGIEQAKTHRPDAIILDIMMPDLDGYETCARIRAMPETAQIPVVFLTAKADSESLQMGFEAGGDDFVAKPFDGKVLLSRLNAQIKAYHAQRKLSVAEAELVSAQRIAKLGHWYYDLDDQTLELRSSVLAGILGMDQIPPPIALAEVLSVLSEGDATHLQNAFGRLLSDGVPVDITITHSPAGKKRSYRILSNDLISDGGRPVALTGIVQDVTDYALLEYALGMSERAREQKNSELLQLHKTESLGKMAGAVAHDFNNLLHVMLGYVELLREDLEDKNDEDALGLLVGLDEAANRARAVTRQLLLHSRKAEHSPEEFDVSELIGELTELLEHTVGDTIQLTVAPPPNLRVVGDRAHLAQVILSLCTNATEAMPRGGQLTLQVRTERLASQCQADTGQAAPGDYVIIRVRDSGDGVPADIRDQIFNPFFTTRKNAGSAGLGLSIARDIMDMHAGFIRVISEAGRGAAFDLMLPLVGDIPPASRMQQLRSAQGQERQVAKPELRPTPDACLKDLRVLIAEDETAIGEMITKLLEQKDCVVTLVHSGTDAIETFRASPESFDLAILDVILPGRRGNDVCEELRQSRPDLPVLFMSGYTGDWINVSNLPEGNTKLIRKPFSFNELTGAMQSILSPPDPKGA